MARYCVGALVLLTALLCITWCEAWNCPKCDKSKCKTLTLIDCPYGIGKDVCRCCDRCLKGEDETCAGGSANLDANCGKGLYCSSVALSTPGVCLRAIDCPYGWNCIALYRPPPKGCKYGYSYGACSCGESCTRDAGESCGYKSSLCRPGYYCKGYSYTKEGKEYKFIMGICTKKPSNGGFSAPCPCRRPCPKIRCTTPRNCKYGYTKSQCGCCPQCRKGNGEQCGPRRGVCGSGFYCKGASLTSDSRGNCIFKSGICTQKPAPKCYRKQNCSLIFCGPAPTDCKYGVGRSPCGCCKQCFKGLGQKCGDAHSSYLPCGRGLQCYGEGFRRSYTPGRCYEKDLPERFCQCPRGNCIGKPPKCKYGSSVPRCGCFSRCRRDLKKVCGDGIANCRLGLHCTYKRRVAFQDNIGNCYRRVGICERRLGRCPYRVDCPQYLVAPKPPTKCRFGYSKPICGCKPKCDKGINDKCGYRIGNCRVGYYCSGQRARKVHGTIQYTPGYCRKIDGCNWYLNCQNASCPKLPKCIYGLSKPRCGCCPTCKRDLDETCGYSIGDCRVGYYCRGQRVKEVNGRPVFTPGRCVKNGTIFCPFKITCSTRRKYLRPCKYGSSKPICGCRPVCNKDGNEKCGYRIGNCKAKHYCLGMRVRKISGKIVYTPGRCRKKGRCTYFLDCKNIECPKIRCRYGSTRPRCNCCEQCRVGEYGKCGQAHGDCSKGMYCSGERVKEVNGKPIFTPGRCIRFGRCPYRIRCGRRSCPKYKCKYGIYKPRCACCPICRKGANQKCGSKHGQCRFGYYCRGNRIQEVDGRPLFTPGKCIKYRPGRCPCSVRCLRKSCIRPKNCRWGYEKALCGCCPTCRQGPEEICGDKIAVCRSGYYCKGNRTWRPDYQRSCKFQTGICTRSQTTGGCPYRIICNKRACPRYRCRYGIAKPKCGCCLLCLRGRNGRCGIRDGSCRSGYRCVGDRVRVVNGRPVFTAGKCRPKGRTRCPYYMRCSRRRCPRLRCKYGISRPRCSCCPACKKGLNGKCGIGDGLCRRGYRCVGSRVRVVHGRPIFTAGRCKTYRRHKQCPYRLICRVERRSCRRYRCRYGLGQPKCACCPFCRKGENGKCGIKAGVCRRGYRCVGSRVQFSRGKPIFLAGRCIRRFPVKPPFHPVYPPIRPPRPPVFPPFYPPIRPPRPPIQPPIRPPRPEVCEPPFPPIDVPTPRVWGRRPVYRPEPPQRYFPALPPRRRVSQPKPFPYFPRRLISYPRSWPYGSPFPTYRKLPPFFRESRRRPYQERQYNPDHEWF